MTYEFCPVNNYLFHVGDHGTKFYILIKGSVGIRVPVRDPETGEIELK